MNLILLRESEIHSELPPNDPRTVHLREILKAKDGQIVSAGIVNQMIGLAQLCVHSNKFVSFKFLEETHPPPRLALTLIIGTPRPPTTRRLLRDLTSMGVQRIIWTASDLGEKSYLESHLWKNQEWEWELMLGAMQGKTCFLPEIVLNHQFHEIKKMPMTQNRLVLALKAEPFPLKLSGEVCIAIGPERGWTEKELNRLTNWSFQPASLSPYTLRTETAALTAAALVGRLSLFSK